VLLALFVGRPAAALQDPDSPDFRAEEFGLSATPLVNESLGLSFYYPFNAEISVAQSGATTHIVLKDGELRETGPDWQISIRAAAMPAPTAAELAADLVRQFRRSDPDMKVLQDELFDLGGRSGHLLYVESAVAEGREVGGYLIVPTGILETEADGLGGDAPAPAASRYLVFRIGTRPEVFERARAALLPMFRTVRVTSAEEIRAKREAQVERARSAIESLTVDRLQSIVGLDEWYRIYRPTRTGNRADEVEIGYFHLEIREGKRGEANPSRTEDSFTSGEHDLGLLVAMDARYLENLERGIISDVQTRFWLKWDRSEEVWLTRVTRRQGEQSRTSGEMGIRTPPELGYSKIQIVRNAIETRERTDKSYVVTEPYLSQAEVYLLGSLLPRDSSITGDMSFYYYESSLDTGQTLPLRVDEWNPASDGSGNWVLESHLLPDFPPIVSTYDREGRLVRREKSDGSITEPIEVDQLLALWRRKGLPTGQ
jgi:hypothetical protein